MPAPAFGMVVGLAWNPWGVPGVVAGVLGIALAWTVYRSASRNRQNRLFALYVALVSMAIGTGQGLRFFATEPAEAMALWKVYVVDMFLSFPLFLAFLGTFRSRLSGAFRRLPVLVGLSVVYGALAVAVLARGDWLNSGADYAAPLRVHIARLDGPLGLVLPLSGLAVSVLGIATSVAAYRTARTRVERAKLRALATGLVLYLACFLLLAVTVVGLDRDGRASLYRLVLNFYLPPLGLFLLVVFAAYGILNAQLFDIEFRLRSGVRGGTLAAVFVTVFFVAQEGAQATFGSANPWVGIVAAGALVFALSPLQRFAERVAASALPHVKDTPSYRKTRKRDVYRGAVESLMADGQVSKKERGALLRLQRDLGLSGDEANRLEAEVLAA